MLSLTWQSLLSRRGQFTIILAIISLSVALFIGVELIRKEVKNSFAQTLSDTDLIVGARSSSLNLLLYSVFHIGDATNNLDWQTYQTIQSQRGVDWSVPISLGDSHKGYRVVGTTADYFVHIKYGQQQSLQLMQGKPFEQLFDVVIGAQVAAKLGYQLQDPIVLAHGTNRTAIQSHDDLPFSVSGILKPTGTPIDNALLVSVEAIEAIHLGWRSGTRRTRTAANAIKDLELTPTSVTAVMVGLKQKRDLLRLQRGINNYKKEALSAIIPGLALQQLWNLTGHIETALLTIGGFVVALGFAAMLATQLIGLAQRRQELACLRAVGARPRHIFMLLMMEALLTATLGVLTGIATALAALKLAAPWYQSALGISLSFSAPSEEFYLMIGGVMLTALIASFVPAWRAYSQTLHDGLTVRN